MIQNPVFAKPDCNAVKIEINNPQVSTQSSACSQYQTQGAPYYYNYPQASVYTQTGAWQVPMQQQFVPAQAYTAPVSSQPKNALPPADTNSYINTSTISGAAEPIKTTQTTTTTKTETTAVPTGYVATIPVYQTFPSSNGEVKFQPIPEPTIIAPAQKKNVVDSVSQPVVEPQTPVVEQQLQTVTTTQTPGATAQSVQQVQNPTVTETKTVTTTTTTKTAQVADSAQTQAAQNRPTIIPADYVAPVINLDKYCSNLATDDFEAQFEAMKNIKDLVKRYPQDQTATSLVDIRVYDKLYDILTADTSKLAGPSAEQIATREKLNKGMNLSDQERAIAEALSPKEYAEHNKSIAMFTMASLNKLMIDVLKESNVSVPLVDVPFANSIADEAKDNPNPIVRASAIESLSWIQQPEYKAELKALFTAATNDKDAHVVSTAKEALDKLNQI